MPHKHKLNSKEQIVISLEHITVQHRILRKPGSRKHSITTTHVLIYFQRAEMEIFLPSPVLIRKNWIQSSTDPQIF